jgi:NADH-quinone oxidoreductase subunit H
MAERKICAWIQGRPGPNRALPPFLAWIPGIGIPQRLGLFQLAADGAKFLFKEEPLPDHVNRLYYTLAPVVAMVPAFTTITVVPLGAYLNSEGRVIPLMLANVDVGVLAVFAVASLGIYSLILAGWASNSKYPFLGGVRASAQLISYELSMTLSVLPVFLWVNEPGSAGTPDGAGRGSCSRCRSPPSSLPSPSSPRRTGSPLTCRSRSPTWWAGFTRNTARSSGPSSLSPSTPT